MEQSSSQHTVIYDGECPICLRSVHQLQRLDSRRSLAFLPAQDPSVEQRFPFLEMAALDESIHLVAPDGEVREGADAVEAILHLLPSLSWLRWVFRVPFGRRLARRIYRWVARNRYHLTCRDHCKGG